MDNKLNQENGKVGVKEVGKFRTEIEGDGFYRQLLSGDAGGSFESGRNDEASNIIRRNDETGAREQEKILIEWAKENGCFYDKKDYSDIIQNLTHFRSGTESAVFFHPDGESVIKVTNSRFSGTPLEVLSNKIKTHNMIFPETKYDLLGVLDKDNDGLHFILKQPYIKGNEEPDSREITRWMEKKGFKEDYTTHYVNHVKFNHSFVLKDKDGNIVVRISDARPRNFVKRTTGNKVEIYCIDPVISYK